MKCFTAFLLQLTCIKCMQQSVHTDNNCDVLTKMWRNNNNKKHDRKYPHHHLLSYTINANIRYTQLLIFCTLHENYFLLERFCKLFSKLKKDLI